MSDTKFKIFKYTIEMAPMQVIEMPRSARVLDVQIQANVAEHSVGLVMWALVMPEAPKVQRRVVLVATGEELPVELVEQFGHVKTLQTMEPREMPDGQIVPKTIVYHVFLERDVQLSVDLSQN